jgi:hypothetical protein
MKLREDISNYFEIRSSKSFNIRKLCKPPTSRLRPTRVFLLTARNRVSFPSSYCTITRLL